VNLRSWRSTSPVTWQLTAPTKWGSSSPNVDFRQDGEQLTGILHSEVLGEVKLKRSVIGELINFSLDDYGDDNFRIAFEGVVKGGTMSGIVIGADSDKGGVRRWAVRDPLAPV
jgi:hypothetical protein